MPRPLPAVTQADVDVATSEAEALSRIHRLKPTWQDYVDEGVIDRVPEAGPSGKPEARVRGHGKVVRMLQMQEEFRRAEAWFCDNAATMPRRKERTEARLEKKARKFFRAPIRSVIGFHLSGWQYRCGRGHTFGFLRARPDAQTRPCVRDHCDSVGILERA